MSAVGDRQCCRRYEPRTAKQAGIDRQALRDRVIRFNAEEIAGLRGRPRPGRLPFLDEGQLAVFRATVLRGPERPRIGLVEARFGAQYQESGMLKVLHSLGLSW